MRVLFIDDDSRLLANIDRALQFHGFECTTCLDPLEAIQAYREQPYDVVVTDLMMATMDGLQVLETLREIDSKVKVVLMTGHLGRLFDRKRDGIGARAILRKPISIPELIITLHALENNIN